MEVGVGVGVRMREEEKGREKGERKDWREHGGVGRWRWRKGGYRSREEDIYIKGIILGLARDLALERIPGVHGDVPSLVLGQQRRGCLNWSCPTITLIIISNITIESSSSDRWR